MYHFKVEKKVLPETSSSTISVLFIQNYIFFISYSYYIGVHEYDI